MIRKKSFQIILLFVTLFSTSCQTEIVTPRQTVELTAERTPTPSFTSHPPDIVEITPTPPPPTQTPLPPISKTPGVLECSDILKAHKESTTLEWEKTKILLRGRQMYYTGTVNAVTETDAVHMTGSLCHATLHHVPHEIAINLSNGQQIDGYGTILNINYARGEDIDIEVNPDLLFVR